MFAVVHWKIFDKTGHGEQLDAYVASIWADSMNKKYGAGTHWIVYV